MQAYSAYKKVDVETASQEKLVLMLFDGAIQRTQRAKRLILEDGSRQEIHNLLVRTQQIVTELRSSLDMNYGEIPRSLDKLYEYFIHLLIQANIKKEAKHLDEVMELMTDMRNTWRQAYDIVMSEEVASRRAPRINQHGSIVVNLQG